MECPTTATTAVQRWMVIGMTDNILFIPAIVLMVLEAVAITSLAVSWVKARKEAKEKEDNG